MTVTILFVASNPASTDRLQLDKEAREIEEKLDGATHRDAFQFVTIWATTPDSLIQALNKRRPDIVHFSGHGSSAGIVLEDEHGIAHPVGGPALRRLFAAFSHRVRLVVLNACHSQEQCDEITAIVGCTIGSPAAIGDQNAILFSRSFYRALAFGESVANAHSQGVSAVDLRAGTANTDLRDLATSSNARSPDDVEFPPPFHRTDIDPATLRFISGTAAIRVDPIAAWLRFGQARHGRVMVVGFRDAAIPIELNDIFVPLYVFADRARTGSEPDLRDDRDKPGLGHSGAEISFDDALARAGGDSTCLALIGDPGAGKTTLLRHLFRRVSRGEDLVGPVAHLRDLHPVMIRLATVTDDELVARGLARIVARVATEDAYPEAGPALVARPDQGFLFLLDGLDEVRDEPTRERLCAWLNQEIDHWPGCGFVVTSRRAAWARTPALAARFLPVSVQGMRGPTIARYVARWFHAVMRHFFAAIDPPEVIAARANEQATALLAVLETPTWRNSSRLLEMTANPLMLSTLCLAHYHDTRLPDHRGELYERTLGLLIEVWTRGRPGGPTLRLESARLVLQPLAYAMHDQDRRELAVAEAAAVMETPLGQVPTLRAVAPTAERFLDLVRDECGVLMSRDLARIEFVHLSFQEYLAACHVSELGLGRALADRAGDPRWQEVILLAMSRQGVFEPFMTRALERGDVDVALLRQCLLETRQLLPAPFEAAADRALARLHAPEGRLARLGRQLLGRAAPEPAADELRRLFALVQGHDLPGMVERARSLTDAEEPALRDAARALVSGPSDTAAVPREGHPFVEPVTGLAFVWVPGGSFLMGSSREPGQPNNDPAAYADELPAHLVQLTGFWMSVYPVTNEHYRRFMTETERAAPQAFSNRRFNDPAQPVVTVTWDDARAFAAWVTGKLGGLVVRLPTEAEWEYAARGTDGRRYPWGNEPPDASRATFGQLRETGQPSVVGRSPDGKSPFEVHDLAGNVWEWCLDAWQDGYGEGTGSRVDPCHRGDTSDEVRAVRGGSWMIVAGALRSACRYRFRPHVRYQDLGFRLVCGGAAQPDPT